MRAGAWELLFVIIMLLLLLWLICILINIPVHIAEKKKVDTDDLFTIKILSYCGLLTGGITWIISVVLALTAGTTKEADLDKLEKAYKLMKKGIISKKEYEKIKKETM